MRASKECGNGALSHEVTQSVMSRLAAAAAATLTAYLFISLSVCARAGSQPTHFATRVTQNHHGHATKKCYPFGSILVEKSIFMGFSLLVFDQAFKKVAFKFTLYIIFKLRKNKILDLQDPKIFVCETFELPV